MAPNQLRNCQFPDGLDFTPLKLVRHGTNEVFHRFRGASIFRP